MWRAIKNLFSKIFKGFKLKKLFGKGNSEDKAKKEFFDNFDNLTTDERDDVREAIANDEQVQKEIEKVKDKVVKVLKKELMNIPKSTSENKILEDYVKISVNEKKPQEIKKEQLMKINSSWVKKGRYFPQQKRVELLIGGKGRALRTYSFYNVPKTKFLALVEIGGTYMWDYFGRHYSTNPTRWIRRNEIR